MKRSMIILGALVALVPLPGSAGDAARVLQNLHGSVSWITNDNAAAHPIAPNAQVALNNDDVAQTGASSMGAITLPDSSKIVMASNSVLKLDTFSAGQVASAHFVLFYGKMRFTVEHPQGAKADYTFTTPTGAIAVRGTQGDISVDPLDGVRVNVYHLSDPALPVEISMIDGSRYTVPGGQKIWMRWIDGKLIAKVTGLSKAELSRFSELGSPDSIDGGAPTQ
jgi:FecR protein